MFFFSRGFHHLPGPPIISKVKPPGRVRGLASVGKLGYRCEANGSRFVTLFIIYGFLNIVADPEPTIFVRSRSFQP